MRISDWSSDVCSSDLAKDLPAKDQVSIRVCASAGEALPKDLGERFTDHFGCHILDGIGSTEMLHIFLSNQDQQVRYGTTGKPVPGYEVALRDENGAPIAQDRKSTRLNSSH